MPSLLLVFVFLLITINAISQEFFSEKNPPPGTILLEENYYLDKREVTNIDYREYQYWVMRVYGENSEKFNSTVLDHSALKGTLGVDEDYYYDRAYDLYPVVGVTWEQAVDFANWRTDRVVEMQLIQRGVVSMHPEQTAENHFTYRKYLNGEYLDYSPIVQLEVAIYSLPTKAEWDNVIVKHNKFDPEKHKKFQINKNKGNPLNGPRITGYQNIKGMPASDLYGNVAEMIREKGKAKGGSWMHDLE
ncbi:MAG: SUMF1/EgtB/PvdO family nonheme iron enzyme, partial [Saprospiraceae bacterium]